MGTASEVGKIYGGGVAAESLDLSENDDIFV